MDIRTNDGVCDLDLTDDVPTVRAVSTGIKSMIPRVGTSNGNTLVEIIADGFLYTDMYTCFFGSKSVPAVLTAENKLICSSPRHPPDDVIFSVQNNHGDTWTSEGFRYYPLLRADSLSPEMISTTGDAVTVLLQYVPDIRLFCYFNKIYKVPATKLSPHSVSCVSPVLFSSDVIASVAVGTDTEVWTAALFVTVAQRGSPDRVTSTPHRLESVVTYFLLLELIGVIQPEGSANRAY